MVTAGRAARRSCPVLSPGMRATRGRNRRRGGVAPGDLRISQRSVQSLGSARLRGGTRSLVRGAGAALWQAAGPHRMERLMPPPSNKSGSGPCSISSSRTRCPESRRGCPRGRPQPPRCPRGASGRRTGGSSPAPPWLRACDFPAVALLWRIACAQLCRGRLPVLP